MKIGATSDLHGHLPEKINICDLFLICGDILPLNIQRNKNESLKWFQNIFIPWCESLPCKKVIFIAGNHDFVFEQTTSDEIYSILPEKIIYLKDNSVTYNGIKIYGTPWCTNLCDWAFYTKSESEYSNIERGSDIVMTHQPPNITLVGTVLQPGYNYMNTFASSKLADVLEEINPKYVLCGHVHSGCHTPETVNGTTYVNVSLLNEDYHVSYDIFYFEI